MRIFYDKHSSVLLLLVAPKPVGRRARKPGIDRKPRQAYSAKQLEKLEGEFKVSSSDLLTSNRHKAKVLVRITMLLK